MNVSPSSLYNDFQGLAGLKAQAHSAPGQHLEEVAAQFESIFFQMMMKSMRDASIEGDLFNSSQLDTYQQMFDQQLSLDLSRNGGLGLARILVEQLGGGTFSTGESNPSPAGTGAAAEASGLDIQGQVRSLSSVEASPAAGAGQSANPPLKSAATDAPAATDWAPATPREFIETVWNHAVDAATELGVDPAVLVAQSALETGWGRKVIKTAGGDSSFNLFGIKAGGDWQGRSAAVNTVEYRDGVAAMERAGFRAYDSLAGAFGDYVGLLQGSPRYQAALDGAADGRAFLDGLQGAGYATDPDYADKIMNILERGDFADVIQELKNSGIRSLSG